jgi:2-dehydropantoate 2-reductase
LRAKARAATIFTAFDRCKVAALIMRICVVGSGAVGGFFGAKMARAGHDVIFIARGAHLDVMRARGLTIRTPSGDVRIKAPVEERAEKVGPVDFVFYAVKTYSNPEGLPLLNTVAGDHAVVLTLQNGLDSAPQIEAAIGRGRVLGGAAYVATALIEPGVIQLTGAHRRIAFGETTGDVSRVSGRVAMMDTLFREADIVSEPAANGWVPLWEKYVYLAPFAGFTGAARRPIGPLWSDPDTRALMMAGFKEVAALAAAEKVRLRPGVLKRVVGYIDSLDASVRSSLLIDLQAGKPTEVEALLGGVVRRAARRRVKVPILSTLYAALRPHASGGTLPPQ